MQLTRPRSQITSDSPTCEHGKHAKVDNAGNIVWCSCGICQAEIEKKEEARRKRERMVHGYKDRMSELFEYKKIPKRFASKTFDNFSASSAEQKKILTICQKYVENFEQVMEMGTCLTLCGRPGTGKTHLAYAICSGLRQRYIPAVVINAATMTGAVKEAYGDKKNEWGEILTPSDLISMFASVEHLTIDEVGVQVDSDAEKRIFFDIINRRYQEMLPTVIISNLEVKELASFIGERVVDRLRENSGVVFGFAWESYRK